LVDSFDGGRVLSDGLWNRVVYTYGVGFIMRLRYVILLQIITALSLTYLYKSKLNDTYLRGVADGATAEKSQYHTDKVCSAWLFNTNLKEAKSRICGGKRT